MNMCMDTVQRIGTATKLFVLRFVYICNVTVTGVFLKAGGWLFQSVAKQHDICEKRKCVKKKFLCCTEIHSAVHNEKFLNG